MNRSTSLLFYKLVAGAIFAGVIACFVELSDVYRNPVVTTPAPHFTAATANSPAPQTANAS
ncbi:MAG TPA: hypothetical protein VGD81_15830 [Opitutaceae bacterium]